MEKKAHENQENVYKLFQEISNEYDVMNNVISFNMHKLWKKNLISEASKYNKVLDICCGTGDICLGIANTNKESDVTGLDFSENMLTVAKKRSDKFNTSNLELVHGDVMNMAFLDNTFDAVTVSFGLRNTPNYELALKEVLRVLKPNGKFYCLEASYPKNVITRSMFKLYFKYIMPTLARMIVRKGSEYAYLNKSTEQFLSKEELKELMESVGFKSVTYKSLSFGSAALHIGIK